MLTIPHNIDLNREKRPYDQIDMSPAYKAIPFCLLLLSCSLFPQPAGTIAKYILTKPTIENISKQSTEKEIFIAQPSLSVVLQDHNRVVYYPTPQKIEYLAGAEWAQKLDLMVWESLFDSLKVSRKFKSVSSETATPESLTLKTHIAMLGVEQDGLKRKVRAIYEFSLFDKENKLISQKRIEQASELKDKKLDDIVSSLNVVHQKVIEEYSKTV